MSDNGTIVLDGLVLSGGGSGGGTAATTSFEPTATINATNVQDAVEEVDNKLTAKANLVDGKVPLTELPELGGGGSSNPYPFSVSGGNTTNGLPDLLGFNSNTLSFKVGGSYPSLKYATASGGTGTLSSITDKDCTSLADGRHFILCNSSGTTHIAPRVIVSKTAPVTGGVIEYDKWGTVSIADNVASGFASDAFLTTKDVFHPGSRPWEIGFSFQLTTVDTTQFILSSGGDITEGRTGIVIFIDAQKLTLLVSYSGTSWLIDLRGDTTLSTGVRYWGKCVFTGTAYELYQSTDGINYSLMASTSSTTPMIQWAKSMCIGRGTNGGILPFLGSLYLDSFYIKYNNIVENPLILSSDMVYLNTNNFPFTSYKYSSSEWGVYDCFIIGELFKAGGVITSVKTYPYQLNWDDLISDKANMSKLFYGHVYDTAIHLPIDACISKIYYPVINNISYPFNYNGACFPVTRSDALSGNSGIIFYHPYQNKLNKFVGDIY